MVLRLTEIASSYDLDGPCLCDSGNALRFCCLQEDQTLWKKPPDLSSKNSVTGKQVSGCYLSHLNTCAGALNGEHYLSESVLKVLGDVVAVDGAHWLGPNEVKNIGIKSLKAKILCEKHNRLFSDLDNIAGQFFRRLHKSFADIKGRKVISQQPWLVSGEALERWMLKTALGLFFSGTASVGQVATSADHKIDISCYSKALIDGIWEPGCGLFIQAIKGDTVGYQNKVRLSPLTIFELKRFVGAEMRLLEIRFRVIFDPTGVDFGSMEADGWHRHPIQLVPIATDSAQPINLTWLPGGKRGPSVHFITQAPAG